MQTGLIDAVEYSGPWADKQLGLWKICKYVMLPGVHHPSGFHEILINKAAYDALSEELKGQLETVIYAHNHKQLLERYAQDIEAVEFFKEQGVETVMMDPETVETFFLFSQDDA